jgi:hypothetical protein
LCRSNKDGGGAKTAPIGAQSAKMMIGKGKVAGEPHGAAAARETRVFPR